MITAMELIVILAIVTVLAFAVPRWGSDTHRSGEWDTPYDPPRRPDRGGHTLHLRH